MMKRLLIMKIVVVEQDPKAKAFLNGLVKEVYQNPPPTYRNAVMAARSGLLDRLSVEPQHCFVVRETDTGHYTTINGAASQYADTHGISDDRMWLAWSKAGREGIEQDNHEVLFFVPNVGIEELCRLVGVTGLLNRMDERSGPARMAG